MRTRCLREQERGIPKTPMLREQARDAPCNLSPVPYPLTHNISV